MIGEKRIQVDGPIGADGNATKLEYRVWNPFRSKLAAAILGGVDNIHMGPGSKVSREREGRDLFAKMLTYIYFDGIDRFKVNAHKYAQIEICVYLIFHRKK